PPAGGPAAGRMPRPVNGWSPAPVAVPMTPGSFPAPDAIFTPTGQTVATPKLPEISLPQRTAPIPVSELPPAVPTGIPATLPPVPPRP
ncbi:MAG: hypothetical protein K2X82_01130, partial [Gemmataceae bacterium]|nr:hypothetical protein [Gemmataceae bacterium]